MSSASASVLINGRKADAESLLPFAVLNDGHFTAMQVRGRAARGVDLHLRRLAAAHRRLYRSQLDTDWARDLMRQAVRERPDAYLRVIIAQRSDGEPQLMTVVRDPIDPDPRPLILRPVPWTRAFAEVKSVGTFPQIQLAREAEAEGFDDALLIAPDGRVSETTIANIAFVRDRRVVWPDAPALRGITQQLLEAALPTHGFSTTTAAVRLADCGEYPAAVLTNSIGVAPVARVEDIAFPDAAETALALQRIYESIPPQLL